MVRKQIVLNQIVLNQIVLNLFFVSQIALSAPFSEVLRPPSPRPDFPIAPSADSKSIDRGRAPFSALEMISLGPRREGTGGRKIYCAAGGTKKKEGPRRKALVILKFKNEADWTAGRLYRAAAVSAGRNGPARKKL
jgi:hypothetical protein